MQAWVSCFGSRTTACDPHVQGGGVVSSVAPTVCTAQQQLTSRPVSLVPSPGVQETNGWWDEAHSKGGGSTLRTEGLKGKIEHQTRPEVVPIPSFQKRQTSSGTFAPVEEARARMGGGGLESSAEDEVRGTSTMMALNHVSVVTEIRLGERSECETSSVSWESWIMFFLTCI